MKRVVVTGIGVVAPTGNNVSQTWDNAILGKSGIGKITLFDAAHLPVQIAGEVKNSAVSKLVDPKEERRLSRFVKHALNASGEAFQDANINTKDENMERYGCIIGVGLGDLGGIEENTLILNNKGYKKVSPFFIPYTIPNMAAGVVSKALNLKGPNLCITTACTSGTHSVGEGFRYIQNNLADVMVVGGAEAAVSPLGIVAFAVMKALSSCNDDPEHASRPFDLNRDGFVMGEGSGILVLEELNHAKARQAKIYCEVIGYGVSSDAYHITSPSPGGEGAERCMRLALYDAGIKPSQIDYINAHGTSTKMNDAYESAAIMRLFSDHAPKLAVTSTKGVTGHCLGAAGGIEAVFLAKSVFHDLIPPTAGWHDRDPECPLDYVPKEARSAKIHFALSNSFGFGGTNASIIFRKFTG